MTENEPEQDDAGRVDDYDFNNSIKQGVTVTEELTSTKNLENLGTHLKWEQISDRLLEQLKPIMKLNIALEPATFPSLKITNNFKSLYTPLFQEKERLSRIFENIKLSNYQLSGLEGFLNQTASLQKYIRTIISPAFNDLQRSFKELPPKLQKAILLLAQHGWYFDLQMSLPKLWKMTDSISTGKVEDVENILIEYFESQLDEIEANINSEFPHRSHIISSAIGAHRDGKYILSIPVLLAQADGLCKELVDQYLFMKKNKKPRTALYVEQVAVDTFKAAILSPLAEITPISASEYERDDNFHLLNRHMVLHGESLDYGNKVNSLKAISLINYVSQVLKSDNNDNPET